MEACFYECDHNLGKFRKNYNNQCTDADGSQNGWEIKNLPLSSSMVTNWWNACSSDLFCTGASGSYFALPTLGANACVPPPAGSPRGTETATCKKFSNIYANSTDFINRLWDGSFSVAATGGFNFPLPMATPYDNTVQNANPNNAASTVADPPFCGFRPTVSGWIQAMNDFKLYATNMATYGGRTFTGATYTATSTLSSASWWTIPTPATPAAAHVCSSAPAVRVASAVGAVALAALLLA